MTTLVNILKQILIDY